ncbi:MAG: hypothetical protein WEH44_05795, partial [Pirellulaceae bacterium]
MSQVGTRRAGVDANGSGNGAPIHSDGAASADDSSPFASAPPSVPSLPHAAGPWLARVEPLLDYLGDLLNPILVKEARQAMKSRQFSVTFALLLILGWIWTVGFIAYWNVSLYYQSY